VNLLSLPHALAKQGRRKPRLVQHVRAVLDAAVSALAAAQKVSDGPYTQLNDFWDSCGPLADLCSPDVNGLLPAALLCPCPQFI
jgi:hypothetical protein